MHYTVQQARALPVHERALCDKFQWDGISPTKEMEYFLSHLQVMFLLVAQYTVLADIHPGEDSDNARRSATITVKPRKRISKAEQQIHLLKFLQSEAMCSRFEHCMLVNECESETGTDPGAGQWGQGGPRAGPT